MTQMMQDPTPTAIVIEYLQTNLNRLEEELTLTAGTSLIRSGLIDSLTLFKLITFIQKRFGIKIDPHEITLENFATTQAIAMLVESKQQG